MKRKAARLAGLVATSMLIAALGVPQAARAIGPRCYVDINVGGGTLTGDSWTNAYINLQTAVMNPACTEIWVADGLYTPGATAGIFFQVLTGAKVYGGFAGTEGTLEERDPWSNVTILSGDIGHDDLQTIAQSPSDIVNTNSQRVVRMVNVTSATVLDGFTITAGSGTYGAGLDCYSGSEPCSPTLANLVFSGNYASSSGAGMYLDTASHDSRPSLTNVTFRGNKANLGGAMYNRYGSPILSNVTFYLNEAVSHGGAMFSAGTHGESSPELKNVTFSNNIAGGNGGAMYNQAGVGSADGGISNPKLINVTFNGNNAQNGGAIYNRRASGTVKPKLTNVILWGNTAAVSGQQIFNEAGAAPIINYSVVQDGNAGSNIGNAFSNGTGNTSASPRLTAVGNYGGHSYTYLPMAGSSAMNKGNNAACPSTDERGVPRPQGARCDIGATEVQHVAVKSQGGQDGWILEASDHSVTGGTLNAGAATLRLGDDALNRQYRSVLSFNTSNLPDSGVQISSILLRVRRAGVTGDDPSDSLGSIQATCSNTPFGGNPVLEPGDFQAAGTEPGAVWEVTPALATGSWLEGYVLQSAFDCMNATGPTQLRLAFFTDSDNDIANDILKIFSGNALAGQRPQLIITYYMP